VAPSGANPEPSIVSAKPDARPRDSVAKRSFSLRMEPLGARLSLPTRATLLAQGRSHKRLRPALEVFTQL